MVFPNYKRRYIDILWKVAEKRLLKDVKEELKKEASEPIQEMDLDRFRNIRVCLWVTSSEYLKKDHHGFLLELRPPHYFVKEK